MTVSLVPVLPLQLVVPEQLRGPVVQEHIEGFVEGFLERIGEGDAVGEDLLWAEWEAGDQDLVLGVLKAEVGGGRGGPAG